MGSKMGNLVIEDAESINTSFPNFIEKFNNAGGNIL
jgi:5-enolpyruvylshikimate-3-phosphate synthase